MKMLIRILWQTGLLFAVAFGSFVTGMIVPAVRLQHETARTAMHVRTFDFAWVVAVLIVFVVLLIVGVARDRQRGWIAPIVACIITVACLLLFTQLGVKEAALGPIY